MPRAAWLVCLGLLACATPRLAAAIWVDLPVGYARHLEHPVFSGSDGDSAARLNRWVNDRWGADHGCEPPPASETAAYERRLTVLRFNAIAALFLDSAQHSCPGDPHPDSYRVQYLVDVKSGQTIDLWARLPDAAKTQVRSKLSELGARAHRNDPCARAYPVDQFPEVFAVRLEQDAVAFEPRFPWVIRACTETLVLPRAVLRAWFEGDAGVLRLLDAVN